MDEDIKFTYEGNLEAMQFVDDMLKNIEPNHKCFQSAPSIFYTFECGKKYHLIAYNTPKSGIKIKAWRV